MIQMYTNAARARKTRSRRPAGAGRAGPDRTGPEPAGPDRGRAGPAGQPAPEPTNTN